MNLNTHKSVQRVMAGAAALIILGVGMNVLITQTTGPYSLGTVLLGLYGAFWAYVLGSGVLIAMSLWLLAVEKRLPDEQRLMRPEPASSEFAGFSLIPMRYRACMNHRD